MIHLNKLTVEGFGSLIEYREFNLDRVGLNIMRGPTGAGKTSIPSALAWGFYGTTLKTKPTVQTWDKYQTESFKGTLVRIDFKKGNDSYSVIRCISYKKKIFDKKKGGSGLYILKNNIPVESERNKTDKQSYIQNLLGYSYDLFINSIIFGQKLKRIIEESGPNKKKIFDEAFEVVFIDKAKDNVSKDKAKLNEVIRDTEDKFENVRSQLSDALEAYDDAIEFEKSFEKTKNKSLEKANKKKKQLLNIISDIESEKKKYEKTKEKDLSRDIKELENKLEKSESLKNRIRKLSSKLESLSIDCDREKYKLNSIQKKTCPTCKQEIGSSKIKALKIEYNNNVDSILKESVKVADEITLLETKLEKSNVKGLKKDLEKLHKESGKVKEKQLSLKKLESSLKLYNQELKEIKVEIKELTEETLEVKSTKYEKRIKKLEAKKKKSKNKLRLLEKEEKLYNWLIKDPLSNNGLKAYIFDSLLDKVNDELWNYSEKLGFRVEFGIDLDSSRKDFYQAIYKDDMVILYNDLSGGQKQLVDFSVALAIHHVISSIRPMNIVFFDEPFEGLDTDCIDIISDLVADKSHTSSIYLITHHPSFNPITSNTIYFKLDNNGNTIIQ